MTPARLAEIQREHATIIGELRTLVSPEQRAISAPAANRFLELVGKENAIVRELQEGVEQLRAQLDPEEPPAQVRLLDRLRAEMLNEARQKFGTDTMTWDAFANAPVQPREGPAPAPAIGYHGHGA